MQMARYRTPFVLAGALLSLAFQANYVVGQPANKASSLYVPSQEVLSPCADGQESGLPLPSTFLPNKLPDFQAQVKTFLTSGKYRQLHWCEDKGLRDTGPFVNGVSYGVHPAVKIYYSPAVIAWLVGSSSGQAIPDGAMIVKEQYSAPAARYQLHPLPPAKGWTIMIKDSKGSKDGWYWGEFWDKQCVDNNNPPFAVPYAGFGLYCLRCHASAEKEHTFSYQRNIKGFPGEPDTYFVDLSWTATPSPTPVPPPLPPCGDSAESDVGEPIAGHTAPQIDAARQLELLRQNSARTSITDPDQKFVDFYNSIAPVPVGKVQKFPGESYDHVFPLPFNAEAKPAASPNPNQFLTSDSCMGCHSAGTYGNVMLYTGAKPADGAAPTMNVSPFGEWRWSPMGLAGRDPIFYAQLESEIAFMQDFFKDNKPKMEAAIKGVTNICFKCHGVMGKRVLDDDHGGPNRGDFKREFVYATYDDPQPDNPRAYVYGALARDGVSCMACHRIVEDKLARNETDPLTSFLKSNITGNFTVGGADQIFGPFKDEEIVTDPMNNSLGIKPKHDAYIRKSRMCGNCHTINLPLMDNPSLNPGKPHLEQLTYLEWLNSAYQDEVGNNPKARTCQDCHMETKYSNASGSLKAPLIQQPIAFIEDDQYPQTGNRLPSKKIRVRFRDKGFARHQLQGLNVSLLEIFRQYMSPYNSNGTQPASQILGVRQNDYMSGLNDLATAIDAFVEQARNSTAEVEVAPITINDKKLLADVWVVNKTGHRLPSGVGFRRAFLELRVIDSSNGQTVWCSGCTNELGVITDGSGAQSKRLPSELFDVYTDGSKPADHDYPTLCNSNYLPGINPQHYQPHYFWDLKKGTGVPITRQDQVQIYEELNLNNQCATTTSFIRRDYQLKDNRLLPFGWSSTGPLRPDKTPYIPAEFLHETLPVKVGADPAYADGSGSNLVRYEISLNGIESRNLTVQATLYYQSIPPYYLNDRFRQAPNQPATQRLYYLTSNLQTQGTAMENWKFLITADSQSITR
jgi:Cytochrome P460